jgi:hypothetical protein
MKPNIDTERARTELQALWPAVLQAAMPETFGPAELFSRGESAIGRKLQLLSRPVRTEAEIIGIVNSASL